MKAILLTFTLLYSATSLYAQRGAIEIGIGAGVSSNSDASGNMAYKGNVPTLNYSTLFNVLYNVHPNVSVGIEGRMSELSRKSDSVYNTYLNATIGGDGRKFVYSKNMMSVCAIGNGKYPIKRGYLYGGLAFGYGFSIHSSANMKTGNESYRAPDGGSGLVYGLQAGYTYGLNQIIGLNVEAALRRYTLSYSSTAPEVLPPANLEYNISAYTLTVGLKFRIIPKGKTQNDIPSFKGKGRSY